ncbi:AfsR/SARP family transcriptional regulator [Nocardiopsis sp. NPDC006198]|uniref:AfsR/SARP family transcriptional regulator n=1 Tax=Nocardiopsis sp. NPDC006198 TaxID=3154472 RepID=UPI00339F075A
MFDGQHTLANGGRACRLTRKQKVLATALLLRANRMVPMSELAACLWGETRPSGAAAALHTHVSGLRRALRKVADREGAERLTTEHSGYCLRVLPGELDLDDFRASSALARAEEADGRPESALEAYRVALSHARYTPLDDLAPEVRARLGLVRVEEEVLAVSVRHLSLVLRHGDPAEAVVDLRSLVGAHPFNEELRGMLMLALARSGRQVESLETFREGRGRLAEEIGVEPGPELLRIHEDVLNGRVSPHGAETPLPGPVTPRGGGLPVERLLRLLSEARVRTFRVWLATASMEAPTEHSHRILEQFADAGVLSRHAYDPLGQAVYGLTAAVPRPLLGGHPVTVGELRRALDNYLIMVRFAGRAADSDPCEAQKPAPWSASACATTALVQRHPRLWLLSESQTLVCLARYARQRGLAAHADEMEALLAGITVADEAVTAVREMFSGTAVMADVSRR